MVFGATEVFYDGNNLSVDNKIWNVLSMNVNGRKIFIRFGDQNDLIIASVMDEFFNICGTVNYGEDVIP